jgi:hypothetical protein
MTYIVQIYQSVSNSISSPLPLSFPPALTNYLSPDEFCRSLTRINEALQATSYNLLTKLRYLFLLGFAGCIVWNIINFQSRSSSVNITPFIVAAGCIIGLIVS